MWFLLSAYFSKQIVHQIKDEEQINCFIPGELKLKLFLINLVGSSLFSLNNADVINSNNM